MLLGFVNTKTYRNPVLYVLINAEIGVCWYFRPEKNHSHSRFLALENAVRAYFKGRSKILAQRRRFSGIFLFVAARSRWAVHLRANLKQKIQ